MYYENSDPVAWKTEIARLVTCEMAHLWFGDIITPSWWSDMWLDKAVSMLIGMHILDKVFFYLLIHRIIIKSLNSKTKMLLFIQPFQIFIFI